MRDGIEVDPGKRQYEFTEKDKERFRRDPEYFLRFRKEIEAEINILFGMYMQGSDLSKSFQKVITEEMRRRIGPEQEKLLEFIVPKWSVGCRRVSPADGYLEALVADNVEPVYGEIDRISEKGVLVAGHDHEVDILVCATGFQAAFKPGFEVTHLEPAREHIYPWDDRLTVLSRSSTERKALPMIGVKGAICIWAFLHRDFQTTIPSL